MAVSDAKYKVGFGFGSDENGLAEQPGPANTPITYPFRSYRGNVTFGREQYGERSFDLNTDGLANYGMYADWLHSLQLAGGAQLMNSMFSGAEAYLEMWERAEGVPATRCLPARDRLTRSGIGPIRLGERVRTVLYRAGQPVSRPGRSFTYCVSGRRGAPVRAVFDARGRIANVAIR
jgi:hypothetical protein